MPDAAAVRELFWAIADAMIAAGTAERGTLMGLPCLRASGDFFAMSDHRSGELVVKLPAERVRQLIASGGGAEFAPAGRVFREWVAVSDPDEETWRGLMAEARAFVTGSG